MIGSDREETYVFLTWSWQRLLAM